ncbi:MAG TPA: phosphatase PAP2 family protein [Xanthobacteraceae bacterium]|jgi:membrane-associated PAP2 superfamily phosphatase|nr:phosphatase PAP2 family protein [Xanthobacteraceae bacterium]
MNRTGLAIALTVAAVVGVVFAVYPRLDLDISALFFENPPWPGIFAANAQPWVQHTRDAARVVIALLAAPAVVAIVGKLILPRRRMLIECRAALFLMVTLVIGPGLLTNTLLKDHWGRARPIDVVEFGGTRQFTPWWDPRGECPNNCSFIAGEPAGAFWTLAPAALAPPQWRLIAYGGALAFGSGIGVLRIAGGGHFFTDVVFAGVFMYLVNLLAYRLIYGRRATRMTEKPGDPPTDVQA